MPDLIPETRTRLDGINRLLEDVFKEPRRLSDILRDAGMGEDEIAQLRSEHLDAFCHHDARTSSSAATS